MGLLVLLSAGVGGYLLGGLPTAYLAGRLKGVDIRRHGSGNVGATNAGRVLGWKVGVLVLVVDAAKGALAAGLAPLLLSCWADPVYLGIAAGGGAILGHVFTPYLRFRGGKGVATAAGALAVLALLPTLSAAAVFLALVVATGFVSLGSMGASLALPVVAYILGFWGWPTPQPVLGLLVALAGFVFFTHRSNIRRLVQGKEHRVRRFWERRG